MEKKGYLVIDNADYLKYFINELKDKYIPITTDIYLKSVLESRGIDTIWFLEYLSEAEIKKIYLDISPLVDSFIEKLDTNNSKLYEKLFGTKEIKFFRSTMKYLFKRFVLHIYQFLRGLEIIVSKEQIHRLFYLNDGTQQWLCGNREYKSFIFPDDTVWRILQSWDDVNKPEMIFLKAPLRKFKDNISRYNFRDYLHFLKEDIKKLFKPSPKYSGSKKTILLLSPLYDLSFILDSFHMKSEYNIVNWDICLKIKPDFLDDQPIAHFFKDSMKNYLRGIIFDEVIAEFNFNVGNFEELMPVKNFRFLQFIVPLIQNFLKNKLSDIILYWRAIENLHKTTRVDLLLWGNPPHRYPEGMVLEFCRINKIPVAGMQHGGGYGSNRTEHLVFDLDFNMCDFYFSYGFDTDDLKKVYPGHERLPEVIPVGSPGINRVYILRQKRNTKDKIRVLYALDFYQYFLWKAEEAMPTNKLFCFQKKIIDLLKTNCKGRIILKFLPGSYVENPLKPYLENLDSHCFEIVDNMSFRKILVENDAEFILLDVCSTTLSESLMTDSNIIVYNDRLFAPLTEDAFQMLNKRAIVCNTQEEFLNSVKECLDGKIPKRDLCNREFLEKYSIYKGNPEENIKKGLSYILSKT